VFGVVTLAIGLSHALVDLRAGNGCCGKVLTPPSWVMDGRKELARSLCREQKPPKDNKKENIERSESCEWADMMRVTVVRLARVEPRHTGSAVTHCDSRLFPPTCVFSILWRHCV
jgi:hypothetical protein